MLIFGSISFPIKTPVTILLVLSFPDGVMKLHDIHRDKIKKSTGFRFNVKAVNLFRLIQLYICSMRTICLYVLFLTSVILCAQDKAFWIWPVAEQKAEDGILYRPQDFIGTELNFDNMFVGGKEGSPILCPFDAVVNRVSLTFKYNLSQCISRQYLGDQKNGIKLIDANCDKKYINGQIALQSKSGGVLYISGLNFARTFKTGERLMRGDTIGFMSYAYKNIPEPCICIAYSRNGRSADPMSPFGLKTTFVAPQTKPRKTVLTRKEAGEDLIRFSKALKNLYPCVEDLTMPKTIDSLTANIIASLPDKIDGNRFYRACKRINSLIHDSHLDFWINMNINMPNSEKWFMPLAFGQIGGKVIVTQAIEGKEQYVGRELEKVDGRQVEDIVRETATLITNYDGKVESMVEEQLASNLCTYYQTLLRTCPTGKNIVRYEFTDGEELTLDMLPRNKDVHYKDYQLKLLYDSRNQWWNRFKLNFVYRPINDSTAYLGLSTFNLNDVEVEQLIDCIKDAENTGYKNLIFDVRNNLGGNTDVLYRLLDCFVTKPYTDRGGYQMVNNKCISGTTNFIENDTLTFSSYSPQAGKKGYYLSHEKASGSTNNPVIYHGRLYVFINSSSKSAASEFAGCLARNRSAYLVGRETGTAYHYMKALKFANVSLANSGTTCRIPLVKCVMDEIEDERFPYNRGVLPDCTIPLTFEEIYRNEHELEDPYIQKTLELICKDVYIDK